MVSGALRLAVSIRSTACSERVATTGDGPDLYLYLTRNPADGDEAAFDDDHVSLGRLKGNLGDQNYDVPGNVNLAALGTVVIWCDRFNSPFGAADLTTA